MDFDNTFTESNITNIDDSYAENAHSRFRSVTESDVNKLINDEENENTKKKTVYDINIVKAFLAKELNETRDIEKIPPDNS